VILTGLAAAAFYHPPYALVRPGQVIDVTHDIEISGVPVHAPHGRYLLVTVRAARPSLLSLAVSALRGRESVERVRHPTPGAAAQARDILDAEFSASQRDAATAAAEALGVPGASSGTVPFTVHFRHHDVVGPSAGLVYALAIDDLLSGADFAHGRTIAATGEIDGHGDVGSVSYVGEKAIGARLAGADLLLTPSSQAHQADTALAVLGVSSLEDAVAQLSRS
jgi:PDZ domain-containing protein